MISSEVCDKVLGVCTVFMALAQVPSISSSWLAKQCGPLTRCCTYSSNVQLVPSIQFNLASVPWPTRQPAQHHSKGQHLLACAAVSSPTSPVDFEDATQARLYMVYEFFHQHQRLPSFHEQHNNVAVGHWSEQCRLLHQDSKLELELVEALESIPDWTWKVQSKTLAAELAATVALLQLYYQQNQRMPRLRSNQKSKATAEDKAATAAVLRVSSLANRLQQALFLSLMSHH